jgi:hypothetical protein
MQSLLAFTLSASLWTIHCAPLTLSSSAPRWWPPMAIRNLWNSSLWIADSLTRLGARAFPSSARDESHAVAELLAGSARNAVSSRLARGRNTSPISALQSMKVSCAAIL